MCIVDTACLRRSAIHCDHPPRISDAGELDQLTFMWNYTRVHLNTDETHQTPKDIGWTLPRK
ncbi:hypothetical protein CLV41_10995 [Roseibium marinum]|uniref:Uncharacterized protein n=1 Tax=Roseibium marinum TaxID=281252 RepID=A0A2S3UNN2_9HYPH|nr:hypothetical protein CLV41_10995 [Roseibium marinum]